MAPAVSPIYRMSVAPAKIYTKICDHDLTCPKVSAKKIMYMRNSRLITFATLSFLLLQYGCALLEKNIQTPTVEFAGSRLESASLHDAKLNFLIHVENPNPVALPIQGLNYSLDINHKKLLSGSAQQGTRIPAESGIDLSLPIVIRYEDFLEGLHQLQQQNSFEYTLQGDVNLGILQVPYSASGSIPLPKLPQITLKTIKVRRFTLEGIETAMLFNVSNANDFPVRADGMSYQLLLDNVTTVSGENTQAIDVPPHSNSTIEINNKLNLTELGKVFDTFRQGHNIKTQLTGQLNIPVAGQQNKTIPFSWSGDTSIFR